MNIRFLVKKILIETFEKKSILLKDLPEDMQVLISQLFEDKFAIEPPKIFPLITIDLDKLPILPLDKRDRGEKHVEKMIGLFLPPIIVSNGKLIDGRHRIHAAKKENKKTIKAIDLTSFSI
ncbi:MAG: hypothetical protein A3D92_20710 [Bacteroidetes bacterium RIFCSPHIGHO2_02_FULL_44_7]|nr:MAG: hypothetical protein A3D92_20710 [Bacteroidetes bacterium RIFCSPHIGHO2_02_FULL_44_7]